MLEVVDVDGRGPSGAPLFPLKQTAKLESGSVYSPKTPIMTTGNKQADEDILAFYKARDELLKRNSAQMK